MSGRPAFSNLTEDAREASAREGLVETEGPKVLNIENGAEMAAEGGYIIKLQDWQQTGISIEHISAFAHRTDTTSGFGDKNGLSFDPEAVEYRLLIGKDTDDSGFIDEPRVSHTFSYDSFPVDFVQPIRVESDEQLGIYAQWVEDSEPVDARMVVSASVTFRQV